MRAFERFVKAFDLAVGLGMMWRAVDVADFESAQTVLEDPRQVPNP